MLKKIIKYADHLLFPPVCPFCKKVLKRKEEICDDCLHMLPFIIEPYCRKCGKQLKEDSLYCLDCSGGYHLYDEGRGVWVYKEAVSDAILALKYHNMTCYADIFAHWINRYLGHWIKSRNIDLIIPVPIHKNRLMSRGYNQAGIIAEKLSEISDIPFNQTAVVRIKNTRPQKELSLFERLDNMQNAFQVVESIFLSKNILIIDDIYTTGMTIDSLCLVLKKAGAHKVYFATISIGIQE